MWECGKKIFFAIIIIADEVKAQHFFKFGRYKESTLDGIAKTTLYKLRNYGYTADNIIDAFNKNIDIINATRFCDLPEKIV